MVIILSNIYLTLDSYKVLPQSLNFIKSPNKPFPLPVTIEGHRGHKCSDLNPVLQLHHDNKWRVCPSFLTFEKSLGTEVSFWPCMSSSLYSS